MENNEKLEKMRHTLSHVLAAAVKELYPTTTFGIGPAIENGFYYLALVVLVCTVTDVFAYFIGKAFGKHTQR